MKSLFSFAFCISLSYTGAIYTNAHAAPDSVAAKTTTTDGRKQPTYSDFFGREHNVLSPVRPTGTQKVAVQVGNTDYSIPANYLDMTPNPNCGNGDILMFALVPGFEGKTPENDNYFHTFAKDRRSTPVLIETWPGGKVGIDKSLDIRLKSYLSMNQYVDGGNTEGLHVWKAAHKQGLGARTDLLENREGGKLTSFLACTRDGDVPNPICIDAFLINDAEVTFNFPLPWLSDWRTHEAEARKFIKSITVGTAASPKSMCKKN